MLKSLHPKPVNNRSLLGRRESTLRLPMLLTVLCMAAIVLLGMLGCGDNETAEPAPTAAPAAAATTTPSVEVIQVATVEADDATLQHHLATRVLEVGTQRVAFLLNTQKALVNAPQVEIAVTPPGADAPATRLTGNYNEWPYGVRGSYTSPIDFPEAGEYLLTVAPVGGDVAGEAYIPLTVLADTPVPSVGETAPASRTKTLADGLHLVDLTTAYQPDAGLYEVSVADAVASGRPSVIVFATPAFCTSRTCGPQVDTVAELRAEHPDAADYVHVELYDNPAEIQGDLSRAELVPAADEWGFTRIPGWTNESWVFVLDGDGVVRHRFEGFATLAELEAALMDVSGS